MARPGRSMLLSLLLFTIILTLMEMYREKLASSEFLTIVGGFISSLLFLMVFTETCGVKTGWGTALLAEIVALVAAGTVHRVCVTTCFFFSAGLLYEVDKFSAQTVAKGEPKGKRH